MGINVSRRYTTWLRSGIWIFLAISLWINEDTSDRRYWDSWVQVFRVACVTRGVSDGQGAGNQERSRLEQGGKSVGRESEVWGDNEYCSHHQLPIQARPAAIHQIVSEVLDARMFWRTNFICLKSKRKDIWPICVWLRFRIQPNSIDIATNCIRQKGKNQLIQIMLISVLFYWRRVYDDEIIPRL